MPTPGFVASAPFSEEHPKALAVYCSDGRFTEAVEDLLASVGNRRIDTLTIPGGAALLHFWSAASSAREQLCHHALAELEDGGELPGHEQAMRRRAQRPEG